MLARRKSQMSFIVHLSGSDLQRFVSRKTRRPLTCSYSAFDFDGKICGALLDADNHGIWTDEMFNARFAEAGVFHPAHAVCTRVIESTSSFD